MGFCLQVELRASVSLLLWEHRVLQRFPHISPGFYVCCLFFSVFLVRLCGYLWMDELHQAVAPFLPASGGGMSGSAGSMGSGGGGSGWTSFDLGVLAEDDGEEVNPPNPQNAPANPMEAGLHEPDMDSVRAGIKKRLWVQRLGRKGSMATITDPEVEAIIDLKNQILDRMAELDHTDLWNTHRNRLIRDFIQTPQGGEYRTSVLEAKLLSLFGEDPASSLMYKQLIRLRDSFHIDALFRGPRGN